MKDIYIILSYTGTYFSTFLRLVLREKYVHVSVSLDKNLKNVYSFGRKNPKRIFPNGFVKEDMELITNFFQDASCQIYKLSITKKQLQQLRCELKKYKIHDSEYRYNIKGLIPIKFNKIYHRRHHFVCSQFVGKLFQDSEIYQFNKDYSLIKPKDIIHIPSLELIYEGKIIDYL